MRFADLYLKVSPETVASLRAFRNEYAPKKLRVNGAAWEYTALGQGDETILFLHGMTGAYDIWWQQMAALQKQYRLISLTYPPVDTLKGMAAAVLAILDAESAKRVNLVGTSLGGYFSQYLVAHHPDRILRAVFSNTFPPNDLIAARNRTIGMALPYLPEWFVLNFLRSNFQKSIYPASGYDELTLAFLMEIGLGRMGKAQVLARYRCVVDPFPAPDPSALDIPVMIVEADNDPLVERTLREQLKATYPSARVHTFSGAGHFLYLNHPEEFTSLLAGFFK